MDDVFKARLLNRRQIDQAFAIVRTIIPDLQVDRWRAFASALIGGGDPDWAGPAPTGIMTVQNDHGYIHGLFSYSLEEHLRHGRILTVENFIVVDMFDPAGTAGALLRAMDRTARALRCKAIHTNLPETYATLPEYCTSVLGYFQTEGHAVATLRLCKPVDGANDNDSAPCASRAE